MLDKKFGAAGAQVVIEEFVTGPEVSVLAFCDGKTILPMVSAQDHKRAYDGDEGLNTVAWGPLPRRRSLHRNCRNMPVRQFLKRRWKH